MIAFPSGVARGEVSVEILEKELNNPNATPQSREIIAAVLFEYTNSARNTLHQQQHLTYANDINSQNFVKNNQFFNKNVSPDGKTRFLKAMYLYNICIFLSDQIFIHIITQRAKVYIKIQGILVHRHLWHLHPLQF